ncbi:MAG: YicC family protein [Tannerellaceae bacterium]|jgi:uncharacterized protein (TIGR00255 family)|nr:YicC family protein [Tannerellaceae bacterium]
MLESMTGFGKETVELPDKKITIEIKTLNSKQFDLSSKIPSVYKEKEMGLRSLLMAELERGKIDFSIQIETIGKELPASINKKALEIYYKRIKSIAAELGISEPADWFTILLRMPEVLQNEVGSVDDDEWNLIQAAINKTIERLREFRIQEGEMLRLFFIQKIEVLFALLVEVEQYEAERLDKIRSRITESLEKLVAAQYDANRLEQEMIYYLEKLDVNEEKNRLSNHLNYFIDTINTEQVQGKKLGFILQEIGREINTLGSKCNHAAMQQVVVRMKDELEQIKEQVLNIL